MGLSWDGMAEQADDRQPSGGKISRRMSGPFFILSMSVRNEYGTVIGEVVIEELIPLVPTAVKDRVIRAGIWEAEIVVKPTNTMTKLLSEGTDPFPDEEQE